MRVSGRRGRAPPRRSTFRNVLAFENFLLLMAVIFGFQFVDRSFGPVLPLHVAALGVAAHARGDCLRRGCSRSSACCGGARPPLLRPLLRALVAARRDQPRRARRGRGAATAFSSRSRDAVGARAGVAAVFGLSVGVVDDGGLYGRGHRGPGRRPRHRLRLAHERIARRAWRSARSLSGSWPPSPTSALVFVADAVALLRPRRLVRRVMVERPDVRRAVAATRKTA